MNVINKEIIISAGKNAFDFSWSEVKAQDIILLPSLIAAWYFKFNNVWNYFRLSFVLHCEVQFEYKVIFPGGASLA